MQTFLIDCAMFVKDCAVYTLDEQDVPMLYDIFSDRIIETEGGSVTLEFMPYEVKILLTGTPEKIQNFRKSYLAKLKSLQMEME